MVVVAMGLLLTGCNVEDVIADTGTDGGSGSSRDDITLTKTANGFTINWTKNYSGYSEVIYTDGTRGDRGNGYPFTNNATGSYTMTCVQKTGYAPDASYQCTRPDITTTSSVNLKEGVEYQWLVSYGTEHEHGEVEALMSYVGGTLTIE